MKIDSSSVAMSSRRTYESISIQSTKLLETVGKKAPNNDNEQQKTSKDKNINNKDNQLLTNNLDDSSISIDDPEDINIEILKRLLNALNKSRKGNKFRFNSLSDRINNIYNGGNRLINRNIGNSGINLGNQATMWTKTVETSSFFAEKENVQYAATGIANTSDGRQINFNVSVEMSREFAEQTKSWSKASYALTDPLVINLSSNVASVSDQKFMFDLDADGKEDSVSFVGSNSGFLALDRNGDGTINDGNELFGTKSGDGFKDLARYDEDNNGWIDENDSIFDKLVVWTKDEEGNNKLISLKNANVGAMYLGKANTKFSLNNEVNKTNAVIQSTGVYLKEDGGVGTMQHVDLAI